MVLRRLIEEKIRYDEASRYGAINNVSIAEHCWLCIDGNQGGGIIKKHELHADGGLTVNWKNRHYYTNTLYWRTII